MPGFINPKAPDTYDDSFYGKEETPRPRRRGRPRCWGDNIVVTCKELCGRATHCGNKFCSNHPEFDPHRGTKRPRKRR